MRRKVIHYALNSQDSKWSNISQRAPHDLILGPILSLIYINDLSDSLSSNTKLFTDNALLVLVVNNVI